MFNRKVNAELLHEELKAVIGDEFSGVSYSPVPEEGQVHLNEGVPYRKHEDTINQVLAAHDPNRKSARALKQEALDTDSKDARKATLGATPTLAGLVLYIRKLERRVRYLEAKFGEDE